MKLRKLRKKKYWEGFLTLDHKSSLQNNPKQMSYVLEYVFIWKSKCYGERQVKRTVGDREIPFTCYFLHETPMINSARQAKCRSLISVWVSHVFGKNPITWPTTVAFLLIWAGSWMAAEYLDTKWYSSVGYKHPVSTNRILTFCSCRLNETHLTLISEKASCS